MKGHKLKLTHKELAVYDYILSEYRKDFKLPTQVQIAHQFGICNTTVFRRISKLVRVGKLERNYPDKDGYKLPAGAWLGD